jgi:hypothetical protein
MNGKYQDYKSAALCNGHELLISANLENHSETSVWNMTAE